MQRIIHHTLFLTGILLGFAGLSADTIETKDGSKLTGTVSKIGGGSVTLETSYAGTLTIKQSEIVRIQTEAPQVLRLDNGTTIAGTLSTGGDGAVTIRSDDASVSTNIDKLAASWAIGETDPAILALRRKWSYEASFDLVGKEGNTDKFGIGMGFRAKLTGPTDTLLFYTQYFYEKTDGDVSDDRFLAGVDYSHNFTDRVSWYARDEGGYDNEKDIDFYNIAAVGLGYDFVKRDEWKLTGRAGISYRYEDYGNPATDDVSSAGLDLGLINTYRFGNFAVMNNQITYVPAFNEFSNYRLLHDSNLEFPLGKTHWRLRIGVSNDYNSKPADNTERMDTTYYTKFLLRWE
ncbi:DUF481 domain-containing protein [Opitutaceae bacterium TAV4]|nr:DUF481 domain-containing protein [Opitutaceae bacterium TAV4]RRJ98635.1 DUF481 domain-containing protein [Opitutaceae bacterium TAV3]